MNRRDTVFALLALGAAIVPLNARSQVTRTVKPFRIGYLISLRKIRREQIYTALRELGWMPERDFVLFDSGIKYGIDVERSVKRIVDQKPDLIFAVNTGYTLVAHRLTKTIPIVMWTSGYPVEAGLAQSLARPGKNVTGLSNFAGPQIFGKLIQLLREAKPGIKRVGALWSYVPPFHPQEEVDPAYRDLREAARALGVEVRILEIDKPEKVQSALATVVAEQIEGLLLTSGPPLAPHRQEVMNVAMANGLPTISDFTWPEIEPQPLLRYSTSPAALMRQAAPYIIRILNDGADPGELPIQQPRKFDLVINMKTAKALGLEIPQSLLLRADRVID